MKTEVEGREIETENGEQNSKETRERKRIVSLCGATGCHTAFTRNQCCVSIVSLCR